MGTNQSCRNCGTRVGTLDQFCGQCGASVGGKDDPKTLDGTHYYSPLQANGRGKVVMLQGKGIVSAYNLGQKKHVIGRSLGQLVFMDDFYVSPEHALFAYEEDGLVLRDMGSLNGTFVRDTERILGETPVEILVGKQRFRIEPLVGSESDHYMEDGTMMYLSPSEDFLFRVVHVLEGGRDGMVVSSPDNHVVIGRGEGCECQVNGDLYVSPRHVQVKAAFGQVVIRDLDSKNGTYFRTAGPFRVKNGTCVQIGGEIMQVEMNEY